MSSVSRSGLWLRFGLVTVAILLSCALLANSWFSYRNFERATDALAMSEGEALLRNAESLLSDTDAPPTNSDLDSLVEQLGPTVHSVLLMRPTGETVATSSNAETPIAPPPHAPGPVFESLKSGRWRIAGRLRQRPPPERGPGRPGARFDEGGPGGEPPPRADRERPRDDISSRGRRGPARPRPRPRRNEPPVVIVEFTPEIADGTRRAALQSFLVGSLASIAALVAAGLIWQLLAQRERTERERQEERRLRSLGEMSAVLAHEINNPLASLKGNAQLLQESLPEASPERRKADRLVHETKRLQRLTTDLLELAKSEKLARSETDLSTLAHRALDASDLPELEPSISGSRGTWNLDADRLEQVLANLLRNAQQASDAASIELDLTATPNTLRIEVRDRGPGISPADLDRIFEPFFTTRTQGTGLGLAVSKRIVEMHGGTLEARARKQGGTAFRINLPTTQART